jgi:cyclopropane-fatty-acyl-phospholipid synthase
VPRISQIAAALERSGANLTVCRAGCVPLLIGAEPERAIVTLRDDRAIVLLRRGDQLSVAEAYVDGHLDIVGDFDEVLRITDILPQNGGWHRLVAQCLRLHLPGRAAWARAAIGYHYDRPPEFFLPWFDRWRSYSHGFYETADEDPERAQERKLATAFDALGLRPGMRVLDVGAGWGSFLEFAGRRGVHVEGLTVSAAQERFVANLIRERNLPCTIRRVDLRDFRPVGSFDGAVFMGSLEHLPDYRRVAAFLARHLRLQAKVYADFCAQSRRAAFGAFIARRVWPGPTQLVDVGRLTHALAKQGFHVHQIGDDTANYAYTVRDWADGLDRVAGELAVPFGESAVRTFRLMLRGSSRLFSTGRIQAYHLVAGRDGPRAGSAAT